jgi:hypothetical protein
MTRQSGAAPRGFEHLACRLLELGHSVLRLVKAADFVLWPTDLHARPGNLAGVTVI